MVYHKILEPLVGPGGGVPLGDAGSFTEAVTTLVQAKGGELGISWI